jgi:neutral ceramidase
VARADITPETPIWLSGLCGAQGTRPASVLQKLWAKALAIDDSRGGRVVIVTTDLIGLPRAITEVVAARLMKQHGLARRQVLFNSSHTHTGPVVRPNLITMFDLSRGRPKAARRLRAETDGRSVRRYGRGHGGPVRRPFRVWRG